MRGVVQRVKKATVSTGSGYFNSISEGLLVFIGIERSDNKEDAEWLAGKIVATRIFDNEKGIMNLSVTDVGGQIMVVSQFTLHARVSKGNRPSYIDAAPPEVAIPLYEYFINLLINSTGNVVARGVFGARMQVSLINEGPVTILMDSKNRV